MKKLITAVSTIYFACFALLLFSCGSPSDPSGPQAVTEPSSVVGSWKFADDSDWWVAKSDGTFASKKLTGSWTADAEKFTVYCSTELVYGVRIGYADTLTWYYAALDGKLYKDATPFTRVDESSGLTGIFERVEYRGDMSALWMNSVFLPVVVRVREQYVLMI